MTDVDIGGGITLTVNTTVIQGAVTVGFDLAACAALANDNLCKVCDAATKSKLEAKLTKSLQVSTFNPSEMKDKNNFFNFENQ